MNLKLNLKNIMLLLAILGALLCIYIYYGDNYTSGVVCPNDGCAIVAESEYSKLFGIQISVLGFLYYVLVISLIVLKDIFYKYFNILLGLLIGSGILFTIYLRFVELVHIKAICIWCWGSVIIVGLLTLTYILYIKDDRAKEKV